MTWRACACAAPSICCGLLPLSIAPGARCDPVRALPGRGAVCGAVFPCRVRLPGQLIGGQKHYMWG